MKKMQYAVIFIIVLIVLVFAGCIKFSKELPGNISSKNDPSSTQNDTEETFRNAYKPMDSEEAISALLSEMASQVDENGVTLFSQEELSSAEAELREEATAKSEAPSPVQGTTSPNKNQSETRQSQEQQTQQQQNQQPSENVTQQQQQPVAGYANEYDIFRSGNFYCAGTTSDSQSSNKLEMAMTDTTVYMLVDMNGVDMALLVADGKTYLIYPAEKTYLKLSSFIMKMIGLDTDELLDPSSMPFKSLGSLDEADSVEDGSLKGQQCRLYTFMKQDGGKTVVYMNGNRLLGFEMFDENGGFKSGTYIDSITANIPADKTSIPAGYTESSLKDFFNMLSGVIQ